MATVTSFQALSFPGKSELRQFAELFQPLFANSTLEARREAVAALSQSPNLPMAITVFIATQPIAIAAPFLAASPALTDEMLVMIARTQGADHARAIVKRERLSPTVIDALVGLRHSEPAREPAAARPAVTADVTVDTGVAETATGSGAGSGSGTVATAMPNVRRTEMQIAPPPTDVERLAREEELRQQIKRLAHHLNPPDSDRLGRRTVSQMQAALLVRFARSHEGGNFATTLADLLSSSRWLAERILLDISGRQLATTLVGVAMPLAEIVFVLEHIYPHLARAEGGVSRADRLVSSLDAHDCEARIDSWQRADSYTFGRDGDTGGDETRVPAASNGQRVAVAPSPPAAARKPVGDELGRQLLRARKR
ncbi:DUF2336 domain-containing protein [Rhizobium sp. CECT 9324]|uniref:DUF2336 domain-containing protein n=1 Tax=Rhizobium sp. CECT 9324 TaxID=2845820 RepID=UPI001E5C53E2|nr:DUF2336 domain-containing protein [Rhizobium sp. CECT 9324]CAH0340005.1 hypothetical protein RHI9324_01661 [Rhizobium sp. CECT 9324]